MAAQEKVKSKLRNLEVFLEQVERDLRSDRKDHLCKTIRKDNMYKTLINLHELLKKGCFEIESEKGKSLVSSIRKSAIFDNLPKTIQQDISALTTEEKNPAHKSMAMSFKQSFKESGSDEARDTEDDTEVCSHCATDEKLQRALYFCYNCGVFGRYICGKCLTHHNRIVKTHRVEMISNQSMSRGQTLETELENERKNVEELRHKLDDSMKQIEKYLKERQNLKTELETEKKNVKEQSHILNDRIKQIIDLEMRLSKLAGKKLQEQNADIADLSDPNRAIKLSEKFEQLYDDEWTIAFECLTDKKLGVPLKDAINVLLRLLQECWTFCNNLMATQMGSLRNMFLNPAQNINFDKKKTGLTNLPRITSQDQLSLQDLRKRVGVSPTVIEEVKQALLADSKTWDKREKKEFDKKHIEACTPYIQKCAEICWLMALHDPPLLMKMDVKPGEKFDTNIYTVYSQSGQTIDFLVWPPLYNGKDGGLLSKGVAEPLRVVGKKK